MRHKTFVEDWMAYILVVLTLTCVTYFGAQVLWSLVH
jgi:hypothetical protein